MRRSCATSNLDRYRAQQARLEKIPSRHPETFVHEFFRADDFYANVVLESSRSFESHYVPEKPLTEVWPGRYGDIVFVDHGLEVLAAFDGYRERYELTN